jgi:replicative DNA helicase
MENSTLSSKLPPQSLEAEQAVLGAMLVSPDAVDAITENLATADFYREAHQKIYQAILDLGDLSEPVDLLTVGELLGKRSELAGVGGNVYLSELTDRVPSAANAEHYASIVRRKALLRRLIGAAGDILGQCYSEEEEAELVLDKAENRILEVGRQGSASPVVALKDKLGPTIKRIDDLRGRKGGLTGLHTGFTDLDTITSGLQKGELVIVAARPGMGKTAFCLNLVRHAAFYSKAPALIFSLEMSSESLLQRMLCSEGNIDSSNMRAGRLRNDEFSRLTLAATKLYEMPIYLDDSSMLDVQTVRARTRRYVREKGIQLVMVDYLQLLSASGKQENRQQEVSSISRQLKALAKELQITLLVASQLSRATEQRGGKEPKPRLSDLRESGAIEQDADVVLFIYRQGYYAKDNGEEAGADQDNSAEIIIAKQRSGPTGSIDLVWRPQHTKFENQAPTYAGPEK